MITRRDRKGRFDGHCARPLTATHRRDSGHWLDALFSSAAWRGIWRADPDDLASVRAAGNLGLPNSPFERRDTTVSAIVGLPEGPALGDSRHAKPVRRQSFLPDAAAGYFAPGWDTSWDVDRSGGDAARFLSNYGLGSPFPEDAKLCAALSTFWPAAAPDSTRTFVDLDSPEGRLRSPSMIDFAQGVVCPMTDEELGVDSPALAWDGVIGPRVVGGSPSLLRVEYPVFSRADYTINARDGRMSLAVTSRVSLEQYKRRMIDMARCYRAVAFDRRETFVLSYREVDRDHADVRAVMSSGALAWPLANSDVVSRFVLFRKQDIDASRSVDSGRREELDLRTVRVVLVTRHADVALGVRQGDGSGIGDSWSRFRE